MEIPARKLDHAAVPGRMTMASVTNLDKVNEARDALEAAKRKLALHERSDRRAPNFYATLRELRQQAAAASVWLRLLQIQNLNQD